MSGKRVSFVGGNFKCNGTTKSLTDLMHTFIKAQIPSKDVVEVVVCPPAIYIETVKLIAHEHKNFVVGAQNCYHQNGAFTGEISADMLKDFGVNWVILGHSERRTIFGETDEIIAKKTEKALSIGLKVIGCIGEQGCERNQGKTFEVVEKQLKAFADVVGSKWDHFVIAYEPVWAIGTGVVATPEQAQEVHAFIRSWLAKNVSADVANSVRIIYGGSVNAANSASLFEQPDIDGFLVGGASLKPEFIDIINNVITPKKQQ
eukprot:GEZU01036723.1.p2 GENE.GEZU01036723.1~~GEZU01036723.1.p2  ORF type:complete len:260 (-),score=102.88 GEZU01036723.1:121-900(-)